MRIGALDFLRIGENGELWAPTRAWAVSKAGAKSSDLDAWELVTSPPPPDTPALPIHDLKLWMLFDKRDTRYLSIPPKGKRDFTVTRRIPREQAFVRYLRTVRDALPEDYRSAEVTLLVPALDDEVTRKRYLNTIRESIPGARILPEPEMVIEYFRLVRRTLTLDKSRNTIILVIDIGASTSNATIVLSNRDTVIGSETGMRRASRLQAIQGTCGDIAGHWVDEWLATRVGIKLDELSSAERQTALEAIESAKIFLSRNAGTTTVAVTVQGVPQPVSLRTEDVYEAALEVVTWLRPVLDKMGRRLWTQQTSTEEAKRLSDEVRRERRVGGPEDALKLVDYVLLAGGTTRLPGVRELLESEFSTPAPKFLDIGEDFPIAAAVGALAHVLHDKYSPPRLRTAERDSPPEEAPALEGALDVDILFADKPDPAVGERERTQVVLERGDPIVYSGGRRDSAFAIDSPAEAQLLARLIPSGEKALRRGLPPRSISLKRASPRIDIVVNTDRCVTLRSDLVRQIGSVRIDLDRLGRTEEAPQNPYRGQIPDEALAVDHADELVIDLGMSKTVVVAAQTGLLDPRLLEAPPSVRAQPPQSRVDEPASPPPSSRLAAVAPPDVEDSDTATKLSTASSLDETPPPELGPPVPATPDLTSPEPEALSAAPPESLSATNVTVNADVSDAATPPTIETREAPAPEPSPSVIAEPELPPQTPLQEALPIITPTPENADPRENGDELRRRFDGFIESLRAFLTAAEEHGLDVPAADLLFTLLGLSVRPLVFLAGAPGCGKSTVARIIAHLLHCRPGVTFHDVPVQSHWNNDDPLFGSDGLLRPLLDDRERPHFVLFDEVNLTRPEYYLARFFHALEHPHQDQRRGLRIGPTMAIGTLNIDETSRAPSPKVLDRCFLVEMDQVPYNRQLRMRGAHRLGELPALSALPPAPDRTPPVADTLLGTLLKSLDECVRDHGLREDLLPSPRVMGDIGAVLDIHERLGDGAAAILPRNELLDRLLASRILIKISGVVDQVEPALHAVEEFLNKRQETLTRSRRRAKLARKQARLGFVFPWQ